MKTLEPVTIEIDGKAVVRSYRLRCPACDVDHFVSVNGTDPNGREWTVVGVDGAKTVVPDIASRTIDARGDIASTCVAAVAAGALVFRSASTHALKGQTVAMVEILDAAVSITTEKKDP